MQYGVKKKEDSIYPFVLSLIINLMMITYATRVSTKWTNSLAEKYSYVKRCEVGVGLKLQIQQSK